MQAIKNHSVTCHNIAFKISPMNISPISPTQNPLNTLINPQSNPSNNPNTVAKASDQISISAAARALANSESSESASTETIEPASAQTAEGEVTTTKSINVMA